MSDVVTEIDHWLTGPFGDDGFANVDRSLLQHARDEILTLRAHRLDFAEYRKEWVEFVASVTKSARVEALEEAAELFPSQLHKERILALKDKANQHQDYNAALEEWTDYKTGRTYRWNRKVGRWEDAND